MPRWRCPTRAISRRLELSQYEAVALFVSGPSHPPDFALTDENAPAVAEICRRLDGLPLAIELAAARVRLLTPRRAGAAGAPAPLLTGGAATSGPPADPARHHRLELRPAGRGGAALFPPARGVRRRCTLEAAEAVCAARGSGIDVLDGLASLVAQSLLQRGRRRGREPRFGMLETIREYARERLEASGELDEIRRRHAEYYRGFADGRARVRGADQCRLVHRFSNGARQCARRAGLERAVPDAGDLFFPRLAAALWLFWGQRPPHLGEGRELARAHAERASRAGGAGEDARWSGRACVVSAGRLFARSDVPGSGPCALAADRRRSGALPGRCIVWDGWPRLSATDEKAESLCSESVAFWRGLGEKVGLHMALMPAATTALRAGDARRAAVLSEEAAELVRETGNEASLAYALGMVAQAAYYLGDDARAKAVCEESLALFREVGDRWGTLSPLRTLTLVARREGDLARVAVLCREGLLIRRDLGSRSEVDEQYEALAWVATTRGQPEQAARFLGAAEALRESMGTSISPVRRADYDGLVAQVHAALSKEAFTSAWAAGRAMTMEQAIDYASQGSAPT